MKRAPALEGTLQQVPEKRSGTVPFRAPFASLRAGPSPCHSECSEESAVSLQQRTKQVLRGVYPEQSRRAQDDFARVFPQPAKSGSPPAPCHPGVRASGSARRTSNIVLHGGTPDLQLPGCRKDGQGRSARPKIRNIQTSNGCSANRTAGDDQRGAFRSSPAPCRKLRHNQFRPETPLWDLFAQADLPAARLLPGKTRRFINPQGGPALEKPGPETVNRRHRVVKPGEARPNTSCVRGASKRIFQVKTSAVRDMMGLGAEANIQ